MWNSQQRLKRKHNKNSCIPLVISQLYKDWSLDVIKSRAFCVSFWGQRSPEVFYVQHEIWDKKSAEIRFQYFGVFDGFHLSSLTPKLNPKHLLQVWNRVGAIFFLNCTLGMFLLGFQEHCQCRINNLKDSVGSWLKAQSTHWYGQLTQPSHVTNFPIYKVGMTIKSTSRVLYEN